MAHAFIPPRIHRMATQQDQPSDTDVDAQKLYAIENTTPIADIEPPAILICTARIGSSKHVRPTALKSTLTTHNYISDMFAVTSRDVTANMPVLIARGL